MSRRKEEEEDEEEWDEEEEEEEGLDASDLTQLPGVGEGLAETLKMKGYATLWEIVYADIDELVEDAGVTARTAERMIAAAVKLLGEAE